MSDAEPQIYLVAPPRIDPAVDADRLARLLDVAPVACLRLAFAGRDADAIARAAESLAGVARGRDVPVVIAEHPRLVRPLGLDGVHLAGTAGLRAARKEIGADAILGAFCGTSRHDGLTAGEIGADYVAFGPVAAAPGLGDGQVAEADLFAWWAEMIELPVVAEGGLDADRIAALAPFVDFFALGPEVWEAEEPEEALAALHRAMTGG